MAPLENDNEMIFEDEIDSDNNSSIPDEIPKETRTLRTQAYDKGISDLVDMIHNNDISLDPDYQRNYVWDNKKASLLIESILLNVPIPIIYVAEDDEGKWIVVDGLQRLNSLRRFFDNEFKLTGLEILNELSREQFSTLNPKAKRMVKNGIMRVIVIKSDSHPEIKYDIFQRLNRGSVKLNEQELRNCMYRGKFCDILKELRTYTPFLESIGLKEPHNRFDDSELILRFFAINSSYDLLKQKVLRYPNKMKTFLNRYMENNRNINDEQAVSMNSLFKTTIDKVVKIFAPPSFRRIKLDGSYDSRMNRALMDVIMVSFSHFDEYYLLEKKAAIIERIRDLQMNDSQYSDALIYGTSDTKKLEYRLNKWFDIISEL